MVCPQMGENLFRAKIYGLRCWSAHPPHASHLQENPCLSVRGIPGGVGCILNWLTLVTHSEGLVRCKLHTLDQWHPLCSI